MAFSLSQSGKKGASRRRTQVTAEINVTPLVDVMLVLLVIFMVTAPLLTVGVPVELPKTQASTLNDQEEPLTLTIDAKGTLYLQETPFELATLIPKLVAVTDSNFERRIYVRGDKAISYGQVMEVMGAISAAGFKKVALLSEVPKAPPPQKGK